MADDVRLVPLTRGQVDYLVVTLADNDVAFAIADLYENGITEDDVRYALKGAFARGGMEQGVVKDAADKLRAAFKGNA
jgi:hypothetical protein